MGSLFFFCSNTCSLVIKKKLLICADHKYWDKSRCIDLTLQVKLGVCGMNLMTMVSIRLGSGEHTGQSEALVQEVLTHSRDMRPDTDAPQLI